MDPTEARVALSFLAEPGDPALGALLRSCGPAEIVAAVSAGSDPRAALPAAGRGIPGLAGSFKRWRTRLGRMDLRFACLQSVSVVGARAATGYGEHVATEMAAALAERDWSVVSGGAYITKTPCACTRLTSATARSLDQPLS